MTTLRKSRPHIPHMPRHGETYETPWTTDVPAKDDDPSCARAEATLRIYAGTLAVEDITRSLGIAPTWTQQEEVVHDIEAHLRRRGQHAWFLSSKHAVQSHNLRLHLGWLLDAIAPVEARLRRLLAHEDVAADISCLWVSAFGHGGPTLPSAQLARLGELGLACRFDVYFAEHT